MLQTGNSTTHVIFEPVDFVARLAARVPKPRIKLTRFHGVFAPNSRHRIHVTPARRGKDRKDLEQKACDDKTPAERHAAMTWAQRLKRVFNIDIESCDKCQEPVESRPSTIALIQPFQGQLSARSAHPKPPYIYSDLISKESVPIIYSASLAFSHCAFLSMFFQVSF